MIGEAVDARSDLFAAGAILFEMLAGRPAFGGRTVVEVLHATRYEQPPALTGSPAVAAVDRVIRRALAKRPDDRPASADAMAEELRVDARRGRRTTRRRWRSRSTRLVVLPFRVLRPDPETDFLAFSLPDAIATSLSGIGSLVLRSSAVAARFAGDTPDLKALAAEADVDRVVMGTLLRAGDQLRAAAQLVEAPSGTLLTSHTVQSSHGRSVPAAGRHRPPRRRSAVAAADRRATPPAPRRRRTMRARTSSICGRTSSRGRTTGCRRRATSTSSASTSILDFAPAWAQLGRCHRVIGKYVEGSPDSETRAEEALRRALALNPRLSIAHKFYANLEADIGQSERSGRPAAGRSRPPRQRSGALRRTRARLPLLRPLRSVDRGARRGPPARSERPHQPRADPAAVRRGRSASRSRAAARFWPGADDGIRVIGLGLSGRLDEARRKLIDMRRRVSYSLVPVLDRLSAGVGRATSRRHEPASDRQRRR